MHGTWAYFPTSYVQYLEYRIIQIEFPARDASYVGVSLVYIHDHILIPMCPYIMYMLYDVVCIYRQSDLEYPVELPKIVHSCLNVR